MFSLYGWCRLWLCTLLSVLLTAAPGRVLGEEVQTVTIGFAGGLSGISETFGKSLANAADLAISEANRNPIKIDGKRIMFRLLRVDDRNDAQRAAQVARVLVQAGVIGVIGGTNSVTSIAGSSVYAKAGIAQISPSTSTRKFTDAGYRSTFRMIGMDDDAVVFLADYIARDLRARRVAVIDNGTLFGANAGNHFSDALRRQGAVVVSRDSVSDVLIDFSAILERIKRQKVDAIFFGGYSAQSSVLAQHMLRLEVKAPLVTSMVGIVGSSFLISTGNAANGTIAQEAGIAFSKMPGWKKFETDFTQRFDFNLFGMTPYAYDAANVLIAAVRQANSLNPKKITAALHEINFKGLTGVIAFDDVGNPRSPAFTIYEAQGQRWVPMKTSTLR